MDLRSYVEGSEKYAGSGPCLRYCHIPFVVSQKIQYKVITKCKNKISVFLTRAHSKYLKSLQNIAFVIFDPEILGLQTQ